jgi:hypothetical protein
MTALRLPAIGRSVVLGALLASASCQALFGGFATDNPDNCVRNPALCVAPDQACNPQTRQCEPAVILSAVDPPGTVNAGGEVLTLRGQRFVAGMTVNIDGVPASQVNVLSDQQLTVVAPPRPGRQGLVPIEIVHPDGQTLQNQSLLRYYALVDFTSTCTTGSQVYYLASADDLDHDGKTDLVIGGYSGAMVYLSNGDGTTFRNTATLKNLQPPAVRISDVNGDGKPDLVSVFSTASTTLNTALGNGDGTFGAIISTPLATRVDGLAVGEVTGDHCPDAVWFQNQDIGVQPGNCDGTFGAAQQSTVFSQNSSGTSIGTLVDLDGDGLPDEVPVLPLQPTFSVLYRQAGGWVGSSPIVLASSPKLALVGDYNQDGVLDVAIGFSTLLTQVSFLLGRGGRAFDEAQPLMLSSRLALAAQGDFNGDGVPDLLALDSGSATNNAAAFLGIGGGRYLALPPLTVSQGATVAIAGDWDGDGKQDAAILSQTNLCVLHSRIQ